jgi:hypothetical protein
MKPTVVSYRPRHTQIALGLFLLVLLAPKLYAANLSPRWRWSNPRPHGANIFDSVLSFGLTVQVAERGQIFTSEDAFFWQPRESGTTVALRAVTFFGDRLVVTGENGTVVYGDSLDDFHVISLSTADWLEGVAASPSLLVAVGDNAAIYTSADGVSWRRQSPPFSNWLRSVAHGSAAGVFVAVGEDGVIGISDNGTNWMRRNSGTAQNLNRVVWLKDRFIAVGEGGTCLESSTGMTWTQVVSGATNDLYAAAGSADTLLLAGDSDVRFRSSVANSSPWSNEIDATKASPAPNWFYRSALWEGEASSDHGFYLLAGRTGVVAQGSRTNSGPMNWLTPYTSIRNWLWDVLSLPNFYVAVGDRGNVFTSPNGIEWDLELVPNSVTNSVLLGVGGTTNALLAVGNKGSMIFSPNTLTNLVITNSDGTIATNEISTFGVIWNAIEPRPTTNDLQGVAVFGGLFLAVGGNGTILTSPNGTNWTRQISGTSAFLSSIEVFPGGLVIVGDRGTILTSTNGTSWTARSSGTTNWVYRVRYLSGTLVAVGENGTILTSPTGAIWTKRTSGTTAWLNDAELVGDTHFIAGNQGTVLASTNTSDWIDLGTLTQKSLYGLATRNGQLVAVGVEGVIIRSQIVPILDPVRFLDFAHTSEHNLFLVAGQPDQRFTIDRNRDLSVATSTNWISGPVLEFTDSSGTTLYLEESPTNAPDHLFYRGTLVP